MARAIRTSSIRDPTNKTSKMTSLLIIRYLKTISKITIVNSKRLGSMIRNTQIIKGVILTIGCIIEGARTKEEEEVSSIRIEVVEDIKEIEEDFSQI